MTAGEPLTNLLPRFLMASTVSSILWLLFINYIVLLQQFAAVLALSGLGLLESWEVLIACSLA